MLEMTGIKYEKFVTTRPSSIDEFFENLKNIDFTDFAVIGGDGTIH